MAEETPCVKPLGGGRQGDSRRVANPVAGEFQNAVLGHVIVHRIAIVEEGRNKLCSAGCRTGGRYGIGRDDVKMKKYMVGRDIIVNMDTGMRS